MTVFPAIQAGRAAAERLMRATLRVERPTGETVLDPDTLVEAEALELVYEGPGKVQTYEAHEALVEVAGSSATKIRLRADFPVGSFAPAVDDVVTVASNPDDDSLEGMVMQVVSISPVKSLATAYRVFVDVVTHG